MALADADIVNAVNAAGITTVQELQDAFVIAGAFATVFEQQATAGNATVAQLATQFAQRSLLQMESVALQAQIQNAAAARDAAQKTANDGISALQTQLNAVNAQLQQAVSGS